MSRRTICLLSLALSGMIYPNVSSACLWQNSDAPFWPSNTIEVCFNAPSAAERRDSIAAFNSARIQVRRAYENLNEQSPFNFIGFQTCDDEGHSTRTPKVRIDLTQDSVIPSAASIGPESSTRATNLVVAYSIIPNGSENAVPQAYHPHNLEFIIQHETLHLLGFHHDRTRDDTKYFSSLNRVVEVGGFDATSVMTMSLDDANQMTQNRAIARQPPFLSEGDRACLTLLANRRIAFPAATSAPIVESAQ